MLSPESSSLTALESALLFEKKRDDILLTVEKAALLAEPVVASLASPAGEEKPIEKAEVAQEPVEAEEVDEEPELEEPSEENPEENILGSDLDHSEQDERHEDHPPQSKRASSTIPRQIQKLLIPKLS